MPKNQSGSKWSTLLQSIKDNDPALFCIYTFHVTGKQIGDEETKALGAALKYNNTVKTLVITGDKISHKGAKAMSDTLKSNQSLETLYLDLCLIGDEGAKALSEALKINKTLIRLKLSANAMGAKGKQALRDALKKNQTLKHLELGDYPNNNYIDLVYERDAQQTIQRLKRRDQFTQVLIILGRENAKTTSQSLWNRLPKELKQYIISLIDFNLTESIGKSQKQIIGCAKFIFNNIPQLNEALAEALKTKQDFKIIEKSHYRFQFFPSKPQQASLAEEPIESSNDMLQNTQAMRLKSL